MGKRSRDVMPFEVGAKISYFRLREVCSNMQRLAIIEKESVVHIVANSHYVHLKKEVERG
jgi:hypothetical protein